MSWGSTTVEDDRVLIRAAMGLDRKGQRVVRRSVRLGRPMCDPASAPFAVAYLDLCERQVQRYARARRALRWLLLINGLIWLVHGVLRILYPGGESGLFDLIPSIPSLVGFLLVPRVQSRREARLAASHRALFAAGVPPVDMPPSS